MSTIKINDEALNQCMRDNDPAGLSGNGGGLLSGERTYWEQIRQNCIAHFESAGSAEPIPVSKLSPWEQEIADRIDAERAAARAAETKYTIGEIKGFIVRAEEFGNQHAQKINAGNVREIFEALRDNPELREEYGDRFATMMDRPKLYFDNSVSPQDLQKLADECFKDCPQESLRNLAGDDPGGNEKLADRGLVGGTAHDGFSPI